MLAARVLAPHYREVVVLERDRLAGPPEPRMSAPQSFHLHVLLKGGENAMDPANRVEHILARGAPATIDFEDMVRRRAAGEQL